MTPASSLFCPKNLYMMKFNEKYNREDFIDFLNGFLPEDFHEKEKDIDLDQTRFKKIIKAKELGFCESLDLYILEIDHNSENDPRITIATEAFKIMAQYWAHKALVIFKNNDSENYRLSYLTISLDINDKNKAIKKYSNARRYSFYLGTKAKIKTPHQQLIKKGRVKDIEDLLNRFSVEVVNREFYDEIQNAFDFLTGDGNEEEAQLKLPGMQNGIFTKDFAVRLIGRIMFCWFLKQKKTESGQLIPEEILSSKAVVSDYYHSTLEPLFFEVLNTPIDTRDIRSELFDKVPYLNGGLFSPQSGDFYDFDRDTYTSRHINTLNIADGWFKKTFELLETYNFTIDENTAIDQELSVDPEMLGRIFENLLAKINPETGTSDRKKTGSFYTPRPIVEYMVDQSLLEYLKTKTTITEEKLSALISYDLNDDAEFPLTDAEKQKIVEVIDSLKVLDPACGSGAFPIGMLQKVVHILQSVDPKCDLLLSEKLKGVPELYKQKIISEINSKSFDYTRKLEVIKNSIFGVDIQPIAVDVSRLRCFLTLVVESVVDDTKKNRGIDPLPNLDFKFVCANTLIGLPKAESTGLFDDHSGIKELSKIMSEYFSCNSERKNEMKLKFTNLQKEILEKTISAFGKNIGELTLSLTTWNPFSNTSNLWFDSEWMFGLEEKFDIVLGNPPYISYYSKQSHQNAESKEQLLELVNNYDFVQNKKKNGRFNTLMFFVEKGNKLLSDNGILSYILDTNIHNNPAIDIRKYILENTKILKIANNLSSFENVASSQVILILQKTKIIDYNVEWVRYRDEKFESEIKCPVAILKNNEEISLQNPVSGGINDILKKISRCFPLSKFITPQNIRTCITFTGKKDEFYVSKKEQEIDHPLLEGSSGVSQPYSQITWNGFVRYNINLRDKLNDEYKKLAKAQNKRSPMVIGLADIEKFKAPKIFVRLSDTRITATYTDEFVCADLSLYIITLPNLEKKWENISLLFILGVLNSSLQTFYFRKMGFIKNFGLKIGTPQIRLNDLRKIPFPNITEKNKKEVIEVESLVTQILADKKTDPKADTSAQESEIDRLVYHLYDLTEEEIALVENSSKK